MEKITTKEKWKVMTASRRNNKTCSQLIIDKRFHYDPKVFAIWITYGIWYSTWENAIFVQSIYPFAVCLVCISPDKYYVKI